MKSVPVLEWIPAKKADLRPWILLALGALAVLIAFNRLQVDTQTLGDVASAFAQTQNGLKPPKVNLAEAGLATKNEKAARAALTGLNYPWEEVWSEIDAVNGERIYMTRFEHQIGKTERLELNADSYDTVTQALERLQDRSGPGVRWSVRSVSRVNGALKAVINNEETGGS